LATITVVAGALVAGCSGGDGPEVSDAGASTVPAPDETPSTEQATSTTEGSTPPAVVEITVTGRVSGVVDAYLFSIARDDAEPIVVLLRPGLPAVRIGRTVEVTGSVRPFILDELERELGVPLDDRRARRFEGQPVLVAVAVTMEEEG